jgi:hypothetical protein
MAKIQFFASDDIFSNNVIELFFFVNELSSQVYTIKGVVISNN